VRALAGTRQDQVSRVRVAVVHRVVLGAFLASLRRNWQRVRAPARCSVALVLAPARTVRGANS
jgi:hypothetical protein